ncbi:MAG: hypothetical protein AAF598_01150, partial [Bacteroidota bacterium]
MNLIRRYSPLILLIAAVGTFCALAMPKTDPESSDQLEILVTSKFKFYPSGAKIVNMYLLLLPDGTAIKTLPRKANINALTVEAVDQIEARYKGTWKKEGQELILHWPTMEAFNSAKATKRLKAEKSGWRENKNTIYKPIETLNVDQLVGLYKHSSGGVVNLPGQSSSVIGKEAKIAFQSDGSFQYGAFVGASYHSSMSPNAGGATAASEGVETGTFEIDGYYLILNFDDGATERYPTFLWPEEDHVLTIGRAKYL